MFGILSFAHTYKTIGAKRATPKLTLIYPLTELWLMVGASTELGKIGISLQASIVYDHDS